MDGHEPARGEQLGHYLVMVEEGRQPRVVILQQEAEHAEYALQGAELLVVEGRIEIGLDERLEAEENVEAVLHLDHEEWGKHIANIFVRSQLRASEEQ